MKSGIPWRSLGVIALWSFLLYRYIDAHNRILVLRRSIPELIEEVRVIEEEVQELECRVANSSSPQKLWDYLRQPELGHLHFPREGEEINLSAGEP